LGNKGWNWENLLPYYKKSEGFQVPTPDQIDKGADYFIGYHGENGPVKVGWPNAMTNSSMLPVLDETLSGLGVPYNRDVNDGSMIGLSSHPDTIDRDANIRQDAARAYYWPYQDRPNLKIISNTQANKIIWAEGSQSEAIAIGVEVTGVDGVEVMHASKEVILSAGSLRSPLLLELSGIGNPDILERFDIPLKVNISTVGENLQDQTNNGLSFDGRESWFGSPTFAVLPSVDHIYGDNVSSIASFVNSSLADYAKALSHFSNGAVLEANAQAAFQLQYDLVFESGVPYAEIVFIPIAHSFMAEYWPLLPFSRGSVHMTSLDPSHPPSINPNYFMFEQDLNSQADVARYIRKIFSASPLRSLVGDELAPGLDLLPEDAPVSEWTSWVKSTCKDFFYQTDPQTQMLERF
jgi:choline dehydrogenase-like flavoprotein